jgi:membrane dipeptidase
MLPIFDGHNDVLLRLNKKSEPDGGLASFLNGDGIGHLDLPRARSGGFTGGLFAVFVPSNEPEGALDELMRSAQYDAPLSIPTELTYAQAYAFRLIVLLMRIARESKGAVRVCRSAAELRQAIKDGALATVLHTEGAEPIDADFRMLEILHAAGLRSLGIVWSRQNIFGHGVPFRFPSSPDTGPGLTDAGKALVKACNELGILIDLSHITERGFWDVASLSQAPLVASHSNAHALCGHSRNLTDRQLAAIRESGGIVGINFATCFLRADGRINADTPLETVVRHADYLIDKLGVEGVGLGSDFDGAIIPKEMETAAGLPKLVEAFRAAGYDEATLKALCAENWLRVLKRTWGSNT